MKNVLRDLINEKIMNIIEYLFDSKVNASTIEFINLNDYVSELELKFEIEFEQKTYKLFVANKVVR